MPENEKQDVQETGTQAPAETAAERFERERLSRRQALRKFGMTAGMAAFAMFSVDDLARMVGKAMKQRAGDSRVAEQVAREFQDAGIAFAIGPSEISPSTVCNGASDCTACQNNIRTSCNAACKKTYGLPGPCEYAVSNCASQCSIDCPSGDNSPQEILAMEQCYNSCISGQNYTVAVYPC